MKRNLFVLVLGVAVLGAAWWFILRPANQTLAENQAVLDDHTVQVRALETELAEVKQAGTTEFEQMYADVLAFDRLLPASYLFDTELAFYSEVPALARMSGLTAPDATDPLPSPPTVDGVLAYMPISYVTEGSYTQIVDFFEVLRSYRYLITVESFSIQRNTESGTWSAPFNVNVWAWSDVDSRAPLHPEEAIPVPAGADEDSSPTDTTVPSTDS